MAEPAPSERSAPPTPPPEPAPDVVIAGAPRSGTTWLFGCLARHRSICAATTKEPRYFAVERGQPAPVGRGPGDRAWGADFVTDPEVYAGLFAHRRPGQLTMEGSTDYLLRSAVVAPRLAAASHDVRVLVALRQPVDRALSNWAQLRGYRLEALAFDEALAAEDERREAGWAWWWRYAERGRYATQLAPLLEALGSERVHVVWFDDITTRPADVLAGVLAFLDLDPDSARGLVGPAANASERLRRPGPAGRVPGAIRRLEARVGRLPGRASTWARAAGERIGTTPLTVEPALRRRLAANYEPELRALETMTGRDLSRWR